MTPTFPFMATRESRRKRRLGITPVLAEVVLLSVTLTTGAMLSGYVFGVMGNFSHPAEVTAQRAICVSGNSGTICSVDLVNLGAGSVSTTTACVLKGEGTTVAGTSSVVQIKAGGGTFTVSCEVPSGSLGGATSIAGWLILGNGANVYFIAS
jgi:hypothetical protein